MPNKIPLSYQVDFEKIEELDDRFMRVKIWVVNVDAPNYNNSYFSEESILNALESIKNTPILGYISEDQYGNKDFNGHEMVLTVVDGELSTRYIGEAFGTIPESCNPQFEYKDDGTGNTQKYLTVEGIVWRKKNEAVDIIEKEGFKYQSMELHEKDYEGFFDSDGLFHFERFKFFGCCLLGNGAMPAIPNSTVEKMFNKHNIAKEIEEKVSEYNHILEKHLSKKTEEVDVQVNLEELLAKYNLKQEDLVAKEISVENYSIEELEEKIKEVFSNEEEPEEQDVSSDEEDGQENDDTENVEDDAEIEEDFENKEEASDKETDFSSKEDHFYMKFNLSHDDIRRQIWEKVDSHMESSGLSGWYYVSTVYDDHVIIEDDNAVKFYKVSYNKSDREVQLGDVTEVVPMFLTPEEKTALDLVRSNYEILEKENSELKEFQKSVEKASHEAQAVELFESFSKLDESDYAELKENVHNYSIAEIESKLYEILGRKTATFSKKKEDKKPSLKIDFSKDDEEIVPQGVSKYFSKYGIKPKK